MAVFFSLWYDMLAMWFPEWDGNAFYSEQIDYFLYGKQDDAVITVFQSFSAMSLPDYLYLIGCILIVVLSLVALFALFKWMFTLVWRLFKID